MSFDEEHLDDHYPCQQAYEAMKAERDALAATNALQAASISDLASDLEAAEKGHDAAHAACVQYEARIAALAADNAALRVEIAKWRGERDALAAELAERTATALSLTKGFDAPRARIAALEAEIANWKRLYDRRGLALARPCIECGHVPAVIKPASQAETAGDVSNGLTQTTESGAVTESHYQHWVAPPKFSYHSPEVDEALCQVKKEMEAGVCSTCHGTGEIDETLGGLHTSNPHAPCPDCAPKRIASDPVPRCRNMAHKRYGMIDCTECSAPKQPAKTKVEHGPGCCCVGCLEDREER